MQPSTSKWQFTRKQIESNSPSRKDGIPLKLEKATRRLALAFCQDVGFSLKMNQYTIASAMTYWQRFFTAQSHSKNDAYLIATACLLLAGKVEENFKSLYKITEAAYYTRHKKDPAAAERIKKDNKLLSSEMERVTKAEEVLLVTLDFDFTTSHPHGPLCKLIKELGLHVKDRAKERFCQIAWNFSNDSLKTTLCLQPHSPSDIAIACINLAGTAVSYELPDHHGKPWWTRFGTTKETLMDIERQIMSMYRRKEGESSMTSAAESGLSFPRTPAIAVGATALLRGTPSPNPIPKPNSIHDPSHTPNLNRRDSNSNSNLSPNPRRNPDAVMLEEVLTYAQPSEALVPSNNEGDTRGGPRADHDSHEEARAGLTTAAAAEHHKYENGHGASVHAHEQGQEVEKEIHTVKERMHEVGENGDSVDMDIDVKQNAVSRDDNNYIDVCNKGVVNDNVAANKDGDGRADGEGVVREVTLSKADTVDDSVRGHPVVASEDSKLENQV